MSDDTTFRFRILCIEDEPDILEDLAEELRDHGFDVDAVGSAEQALPVAEKNLPDLIVCDMQMPGMGGLAFLKLLRGRRDQLGSVPFLFLTAYGDRDHMLDGRRSGADDYLVKPIDYDLLIAVVDSHVRNAARRHVLDSASVKPVGGVVMSGREELLAAFDRAPPGTFIALYEIDNIDELRRRLARCRVGGGRPLVDRLLARSGLQTFRLVDASAAVLGPEDRIRGTLAKLVRTSFRDPRNNDGGISTIRISAVIAPVDSSRPAAEQVDALADAMQVIQREGGGRTMDITASELENLRLAGAIRSRLIGAVRNGELHICFQPQVNAEEGHVAAEVLVRWVSPVFGQLSPATFIPIVERAGLLPYVTDWVLRQTALCQLELVARGLPARLSVNIGASEFNLDLPSRIEAICAEVGADPTLICVEITETTVMADASAAGAVSSALRQSGLTIALDDFGTGFSTLEYLRQCNVDSIKIDRGFVDHVAERSADGKIVEGIISLAKSLGLKTVAEGVETIQQRHWLEDHGCDLIQGYLVARPLRFDDYCRWCTDHVQAAGTPDEGDSAK